MSRKISKNKTKSKFFKTVFPIKKPIMYITILGMMLGVRITLGLFSFPLGPTVLSFTWISLFITGFIVGPVIGYVFGWISDSVTYAMHPSIYMWEYSIQESFICLIAGIAGVIYRYYKENKNSIIFTLIIFEIIFTSMIIVAVFIMIKYFDYSHVAKDYWDAVRDDEQLEKWIDSNLVKIIGISLILLFYIILNIFIFILIIKHKGDPRLIMLASLIIITSWIIFSWILGPWAYVRYLERLDKSLKSFKKYGYKFYSISRILKSLFVVPIEILVTIPILKAFKIISIKSEYFY